jgi:hypothetical protein
MGQSPKAAHRQIPVAERAFAWLETRRPQAFPGAIDPTRRRAARRSMRAAVRPATGPTSGPADRPRLQRFPNWHGRVGSDPARAAAFTTDLTRYASTGGYDAVMDARPTGEYAAPSCPASGRRRPICTTAQSRPWRSSCCWIRVPNGSSSAATGWTSGPSASRERTVTGCASIRPATRPWSTPALFDTRQPGRSNRGHEAQFEGLSVAERWDLIEYLKGL